MSPPQPSSRRSAVTIAVLAVTQLIGWGTTFEMLGVLGRGIAADLRLPNEVIFLGLSVMMVVSAVAGPRTGRWLGRYGAARVLAAGSAVFAAGLLLLAAMDGLLLYMLAWCIIGLGGALGLSAPAFTAVVEREGLRAGRVIAVLMLFTGLSSAIFWPLLDLLQDQFGWRVTFVVCAGLHLAVCLPLHLFALPKPQPTDSEAASVDAVPVTLSPADRRHAFLLIAAATTIASFVSYGLSPSLLQIFSLSGATPGMALQLGSLRGVMGISARFVDMALGRRGNPLISAAAGVALMLASFLLLLFAGQSAPLLVGFTVLYGFGAGVATVARALLPLTVFSRRDFGLQSARLSLPQNLANAAAPVVFTALLDRGGLSALLLVCTLLAAASVVFIVLLALLIRRSQPA